MQWLRRHGWWGLLVVALILVFFGVTDIAGGPAADPAIPLGLTGQTIEELEAESAAAYAVFDFHTRSNGWTVVIFGTLLAIITLVPYRRGERRAWRTMWVLPVWLAGVAVSYIIAGVEPDQPPPPPRSPDRSSPCSPRRFSSSIAGVTARPTIDSRMHRPRVRRA